MFSFFKSRHQIGGRAGSTAQQRKRCVDASAELLERVPCELGVPRFCTETEGNFGGEALSWMRDMGKRERRQRMEACSHAFWGALKSGVYPCIELVHRYFVPLT